MLSTMRGMGDVGRGFRFLAKHPQLWVLVLFPAAVTLALLASGIWGVLRLIDPVVDWVLANLPDRVAGIAGGLIRLIVGGGLAFAGFLVFVALCGAITGPFAEILSESVEKRLGTAAPAPFSWTGFIKGLLAGVSHALRRLAVALAGLAVVMVVSAFVPLIGPVLAVVVTGWFAANAAAYDAFDSVFSRRAWSYARKAQFLRRHRGRTLFLGGTVAGLLLVPVVNLVALGVGAIAATLAVADLEAEVGGER